VSPVAESTEQLTQLEAQAERAYGLMYDVINPTAAAGHYSDAKEAMATRSRSRAGSADRRPPSAWKRASRTSRQCSARSSGEYAFCFAFHVLNSAWPLTVIIRESG
jgi:hypothetical protein